MNELLRAISNFEKSLFTIEQDLTFDAQISEQPIESDSLNSLIINLVTEGNKHRHDTWAAHMSAPISSASLFGQILAGLHNGNLLSPSLYPVLSRIEQQLLSWFSELFHQPYGHFTPGGTYSNLEALWQAKQHSTQSRIVYASKAAHYSIAKACKILELELKLIETNQFDQMLSSALEAACLEQMPLAIVATVGTSAAGSIDPIADCSQIAARYNAWCHIDAAWGGALAILPEHNVLFEQCGQADSICFDPHKGWQQPKPAGVLLYKRPRQPMLSLDANYLESVPLNTLIGSHGGEMFLPLYFDLMVNGINSLRNRVQTRLFEANSFYDMLSTRPNITRYLSDTGIICFSIESMTSLDQLIENGMLSKANIDGVAVYRAVFTHPAVSAKKLFNEIALLL